MSAPEIAQLKGGSMNSPLTKRRRAKNSPFHREVTPEDRGGTGLGKHHGGSDSGASSGPPALLPPTGLGSQPPNHPAGPHRPAHPPSALRLSQRGRSWVAGLLLPARPEQPTLIEAPKNPHCHNALTTTSPPTITSLPPLRKPRRGATRQEVMPESVPLTGSRGPATQLRRPEPFLVPLAPAVPLHLGYF